ERGAAMTATVISYRTRSAVREAGKALGLSLEQVDRLTKLLHAHGYSDDHDELAAQLRAGGVDPESPRIPLLVALVRQMQGQPRPDGDAPAHAARALLRPRGRDRDHPSRPDRRTDGEPVFEAPRGPRAGPLRPPAARADPRADARRAALPGAAPPHGDGRCRLHRRRGRGAPSRDGLQALGRADG